MNVGRRAAPLRICVVGAGISGLAAAWEVHRSAPDAELVVLEATSRPGGVIRTSQFAGRAVDEAADAFLARVDDGVRLCTEVGLANDLVAPATGRAFVHLDGALVPLPPAHFLGIPLDPDDIDARLLSPAGRAALTADLARPAATGRHTAGDRPDPGAPNSAVGPLSGATDGTDRSVGALIRDRLGDEVLERIVGPLVGSIHAGDCDRLSVQAAAPALAEAARRDASLIRALRDRAPAGGGDGASPGPVFWGLRSGMETLIAALAERLAPALALEEPAVALEMRPDGAGRQAIRAVRTPRRSIDCDAVVLAVGAAQAARLVAPWAPEEATLLAATETASVAIVTLAYEPSAAPGAAGGSGFLVPAGAEPAITACSWASVKWAHLGGPDAGSAVLRVSLGRHGDDAAVTEADETLVAAARASLGATMGISATPSAARVSRWPDAFPQYAVGHLQRTAAVEDTLGPAGVLCAGSSYHGIGIPACIASGRRAARRALGRSRDGARR
ncbi:MAG: protoporphyrinogen oxidase [Acidimicrobiia bacterium]|nr:protoporphyrinogen oxidase [Acidimicrobiia bacterium]MYC46695.1 protoporphyrinogen oxidase [Acidimicrobiia bacterium]